jgi:Recombination directionality factor-like
MPINGVLDLQRRSLPLGEIRIGQSEPVPGKKYRKPVRRETFRFTTPVEETAQAVAAKFGGTPAPWDRRKGYWVVDTDQAAIEVWVPPRGAAVDAWMEMWDGGKCLRRCDGITEQRSGRPCMCPQPDDRTDRALVAQAASKRKHLASLTPPEACKPLTRINVQIPGLPGVTGVWVLRTGSANAAVETADSGEVLERARTMDVYMPALVLIHWRQGQDGKPYPVLALRLRPSAAQVRQLRPGLDGMLTQLGAGTGPLALAAGAPEPPAPAAGDDSAGDGAPAPAQRIADLVPLAKAREDVEKLQKRAEAEGVLHETVSAWAEDDGALEEVHKPLLAVLRDHWQALPAPQPPAQPRRQRRAQDGPEEACAARPPAASPADGDSGSLFDDPSWADRPQASR